MKTRFNFPVFIITISILAFSSFAQNFVEKVNTVMDQYMKLDQFSGTILVAKDGNIIYGKALGEANKDFHFKNTLDTKFNIGSIGKTFTAIAILQLVDQKKLQLNDPASKYLKDFPFGDKITIHHLLTHTAGTFNYFAHPDFFNKMNRIRSVSDALPLIYDQKLLFDTPGEKHAYSNSGIIILGAIIESISGQNYHEFIRQNILVPSGMKNTGINFLEQVVENRAEGYNKSATGKTTKNTYMVPPANADGGIETTVGDMLKLDQALYGNTLLSEESKDKMFTPFLNDYGYCTRVENKFGNLVVGHGGGAPGVSAQFRRYLNDKLVIIVLSNYSGGAINVFNTIESIYFGQDYDYPKPSFLEFLFDKMISEGIDYTIMNIDKLMKSGGYQPRSDRELNMLGYELMGENKVDEAIAVFKINVKLFPDIPNPYDSLGDAYLQIGDTENAIKNFKIALEKDPNFESAKMKLGKLLKK
jgi:CubicO group peptidase (beta-lactamase class C family)